MTDLSSDSDSDSNVKYFSPAKAPPRLLFSPRSRSRPRPHKFQRQSSLLREEFLLFTVPERPITSTLTLTSPPQSAKPAATPLTVTSALHPDTLHTDLSETTVPERPHIPSPNMSSHYSSNGTLTPVSISTGYTSHSYNESDTKLLTSFGESIPHTKEKNLPGGGNWVVQKYGGTSVGKFAEGIAGIVV
jgi:hypothetical protein